MLAIQNPSPETISRFLAAQSPKNYSYQGVGATANSPPPSYVVDRYQGELGQGQETFEAACQALRRWEHFNLSWVRATPNTTPIEPGQVICVIARIFGLWWLNACRIVYIIDETTKQDGAEFKNFGFAYGTLPDHAETGEERFRIQWNRKNDNVTYDIFAFSRPNHLLAKLGYPLVRRVQKSFGRDSLFAMQKASGGGGQPILEHLTTSE
jgi:uncharacterized protein (UPF0548 family)